MEDGRWKIDAIFTLFSRDAQRSVSWCSKTRSASRRG